VIAASPLLNKILVVPGLVQAAHTYLVTSQDTLTAGISYTFDIRAKDIYENTVVNSQDLIDFKLLGPDGATGATETAATVEYQFELHAATFTLQKKGDYTGIITVTQRNGLLATYYETIGFSAPVLLESLHGHSAALELDPYDVSASTGDSTHFTRLDPVIDFDLGRDSMLRDLIPSPVSSFPTQHFSVWWRGYLKAPASSLYRIHIESYEAAYFVLEISGEPLIVSEFKNENELSMVSTSRTT